MTTTFGSLLANVAPVGGIASVEIPASWAQGRSTFGGLVAAVALRAMRSHVAASRRPRSLLVSFVAPVAPGSVEIRTKELRGGRSTSHLEARLLQAGALKAVVLGAFAEDRESALTVPRPDPPEMPGPDGLEPLPYVAGAVPEFTRHFEYRWALGAEPFSGRGGRAMGGWCRFRETRGPASEERVLALVDAWPAPLLSMIDRPAPASSLTWSLDLLPLDPWPSSGDWWRYRSETDVATGGYSWAHAALWDGSGRLAALSRQVVAVFA